MDCQVPEKDIFLDRVSVCDIIAVYDNKPGVNNINKQRFLAELSKLLTFMYEEDRQEALAAYSRMFEEAEDEQKLLQILVSPTRQAVIVARAYDAKERKLQVQAQAREDRSGREADGEEPAYLKAIGKVREEAVEKDALRAAVSEDQISFFAEAENEPAVPEKLPEETPAAEPEEIAVPSEKTAEPGTEEGQETPENREIPDAPAPIAAEIQAEEEPLQEEKLPGTEPEPETEEKEEDPAAAVLQDYVQDYAEPRKEAMVGWLTLFMLFAIPIGLAACVAMLACALVSLALAAAVAVTGVFALRSLFLGFAVFADMLLVGGAAIALLALALLFLWTAIWFLAGAIPGIIRGLAELGRNWCYKEVAE